MPDHGACQEAARLPPPSPGSCSTQPLRRQCQQMLSGAQGPIIVITAPAGVAMIPGKHNSRTLSITDADLNVCSSDERPPFAANGLGAVLFRPHHPSPRKTHDGVLSPTPRRSHSPSPPLQTRHATAPLIHANSSPHIGEPHPSAPEWSYEVRVYCALPPSFFFFTALS
jgi:hypothetical protein